MKRNSRAYTLLKYLAAGTGLLALSLIAPLGGAYAVREIIKASIGGYIRRKQFERARFLRDLKNLQKQELVEYRENSPGKITIRITQRGRERMLRYHLDEMKLSIPQKWDRGWRVIMFDIPHKHRKARDALRNKLIDMKFYPLQKSVFITPYPCEDEIDFIASVFNVRKYMLVLYISHFEGEEKLRHYFGLE